VDRPQERRPAGILHRQHQSWYFKENLGDGRFGPTEVVDEVPAAVSAAFQLYDFDSDGDINLVGFEGREAGNIDATREWPVGKFPSYARLPRVDLANARAQWVDLNGDGHVDLIVDHLDRLVCTRRKERWLRVADRTDKARRFDWGAPTLTQSQRLHTFFADMTGDGLLDMVRIESSRVEYWPHLGRANSGRA